MPSPLGKVSPKVTEEVRTFAKQKCIAEGDLYGNTKGIRPLPTSLRSATFPKDQLCKVNRLGHRNYPKKMNCYSIKQR